MNGVGAVTRDRLRAAAAVGPIEPGGNDRDAQRVAHRFVDIRAEDDVCFRINVFADQLGGSVDFEQAQVRAP